MYRQHADSYNQATKMFNGLRERAVGMLDLRRGDTVIDAGCGTGLCFPYIEDAIGPTGEVIALDECPSMLEQARDTADRNGWRNITSVRSAAQDAQLPMEA